MDSPYPTDDRTGTDRREEIPAPFDQLPVVEEPTPAERDLARAHYPPTAVPDTGPIPDPTYEVPTDARPTAEAPEWLLETVAWHLSKRDSRGVDRHDVQLLLEDYVQLSFVEFVTEDGADAVDVLLDETRPER